MATAQPQPTKYQYSKPSLKGKMVLNTEQAKFFAGNRFDSLMTALFIIDVTSRKLAKNLKTFDHKAVVDAVSKKIERMEVAVRDESERMDTLLKSLGIKELASYSSPLTREFEITSPEIKRMSSLLQAFDHLIIQVDTAWLHEKIDSSEADEFRANKSNQMARLIRSLVGLGQSARAKAYASKVAELHEDIEKAEAKASAEKEEREAAGHIEPAGDPDPLDSLPEEAIA
ncbi:MAG: DUF1845 domain-containing protein [Nevskiaceae bacterium]|uniref:AcaB family transcriptional regulator n=1 Tax=Pseudomonas shirazica TaxID=1940636 RepID=UPI0011D826C2|nr:AcaB family transcriptional regulator [Pseudomonas shirazica]TXG98167.1 MAG: DUF1845 domain-containing protein [Nevskiaceae bacterium]